MARKTRLALIVSALLALFASVLWVRYTPPIQPSVSNPSHLPAVASEMAATMGDQDEIPPETEPRQEAPQPAAVSVSPGTTSATAGNPSSPTPVNARVEAPGVSTRSQAAGDVTVAGILKDADMTDPETRARVLAEMQLLEERQRDAVQAKARELGIPLRIDGPGNKVSTLYDIRGDQPLYRVTLNLNAAISTGANLVASTPYSLNGSGIRVGVWDGGSIRNTHQELTGRVTKKNSTAANDDHATHVAGTIAASGVQANAKGMAPAANIDSYDWDADYAEMTAAGATAAGDTTRLPMSNHSYGFDATTSDMGRYETEANSVDAVAASLPYYLPFWAAGNEQTDLTAKGGYQSITFSGLAKNLVTVGAVNDAVSSGVRSPAAGTIASFSSLGPCDDGRIKPDLVANGVSVYSSVATGNAAYDGTYSGTSMATPNAMGSAALLAQLYAREFSGQRMKASALKSLLIHTADDVGTTGPDYKYGWGLINVKAASDFILSHKSSLAAPKMLEGTLTNASKTESHSFFWDGVSPIRATVCWTDPAGTVQTNADSRTPNLKHNLDSKITAPDGTTIYQPFVMPFVGTWTTASMASAATRGKNNVDNVEQVYLAAPTQAGSYTITVSLDGTLTTASQTYSLMISGGSAVESNPPPTIALTSPADGSAFLPETPITISATASDLSIGGAAGTVSQVEFFNGASSIGVDTTAPYGISWNPPASGSYTISAKATDLENATASSTVASITVLSGNGTPVISSFTPTSGTGGALVILSGANFVNVSSVSFNGIAAAFTVDTAGQITATVPALATTGKISVVNAYGTGISEGDFTVLQAPVLISQIYGAGGNSGAVYGQDYVELYNRSDTTVSLAGWAIQYASASGTSWATTALTGSIAPGKYYLVGLASGSTGPALPTVDATGSSNMSATAGKVALTNTTTALTGSSPLTASSLQDFVGFGTANASETAPAPAASTTTAIFRADGGATDSGNNSADFTAAAPNPRNSTAGPAVAPEITSASTASGTVGTTFSYQIAASNTPTSFAATGLPAGLLINTATGAITGTPTTVGSTSVAISASNAGGTGSANLAITIASGGGGTLTIFSENMGSPSTTTAIASNVFQNSNLTFTGDADVRATTNSTGYTGASAGGNVFVTNSVGRFFQISGINTSTYTNLSLSLGHYKSTTTNSNELVVEVSSDGTNYTPLSYSRPSGSGTASWLRIAPIGSIPSTSNLRIRFRQTSTATQFRIDDVVLTGTQSSGATPVITASGDLTAVSATYGAASASSSFTLSASDLTAGVLVTPPPGFEVSQTAGGSSGYAATQTLGGTGTLASTTVFVRLAAGTTAGSYSGNVVCTSTGATPVNVATVSSEVRQKALTITANNLQKSYGASLTLGSGQTGFTSSGLVGAETIGSVTLTASGGTAAADAAGLYSISPSAATGGTFDAGNYEIDHIDGTLTVTGVTFADWLLNYPGLTDTAPTSDPDADGVANFMEYFMGLNPTLSDRAEPTLSVGTDTLSFVYRRAKGLNGITGAVEANGDLTGSGWSSNGITETSVDKGSHTEVTATLPRVSNELRKFMRLKVTQP